MKDRKEPRLAPAQPRIAMGLLVTLEPEGDGLEVKTNVKFWYNSHLEMSNSPSRSTSEYLFCTRYFQGASNKWIKSLQFWVANLNGKECCMGIIHTDMIVETLRKDGNTETHLTPYMSLGSLFIFR